MIKGSMVALITPFTETGIDETALRNLVSWHIKSGTDAIVAVGTTGESPVLAHDEHKRVIEIVVEAADGAITVVAGAGSNNPVEAVDYANYAQKIGADAVLCVAGYYNRPSQAGLYGHFELLHHSTDIPIILYNIPSRCAIDIAVDTVARLARLTRIVGIKDATGDMRRLSSERQDISKDFIWLSGDDLSSLAYNVSGGSGCISVTANVAPSACVAMQSACNEGDYMRAQRLHEKLFPLHQALMAEPSPAGIKYATSLLGLCHERCRLPIMKLQDSSMQQIRACMEELELI